MITKRDFILRGSYFWENYISIYYIYYYPAKNYFQKWTSETEGSVKSDASEVKTPYV